MHVQRITLAQAIDYEVASCWWAGYVSWGWLQDWLARRFAARARRKYQRYIAIRDYHLHRSEPPRTP